MQNIKRQQNPNNRTQTHVPNPNTAPKPQAPPEPHHTQKPHSAPIRRKKARGIMGLLEGFLPGAVYNPENKKIFGLLSAEDLLLVALIFLFADSGDEDGNLICLALLYVLLSDYIDLSDYF